MAGKNVQQQMDGGCHCGNIRFSVTLPIGEGVIPVRHCSGTFCVKHGGVYTSHPDGQLRVQVADPAAVNDYCFGYETADFHICRACGAMPVVTSEIDGTLHGIVNVNCVDGVDRSEMEPAVMDYDGEASDDRLDRRQQRWIADVTFDPPRT